MLTTEQILQAARDSKLIYNSGICEAGPDRERLESFARAIYALGHRDGQEAMREQAAIKADLIGADYWALYKGYAPYTGKELGRADPNIQGISNGAELVAEAIRALPLEE